MKYFLYLPLLLFFLIGTATNNLAVSDINIQNIDTGIISTPREVLELTDEVLKQFESNHGWINILAGDEGGIDGIEVEAFLNSREPMLILYPGSLLDDKTKFQFEIQSDIETTINGQLRVVGMNGQRYEVPEIFQITSSPNLVDIHLKGLPLSVGEISEIHWELEDGGFAKEEKALIALKAIGGFRDTSEPELISMEVAVGNLSQSSSSANLVINDIKFDEKVVQQGDFVSNESVLTTTIESQDIGVRTWGLLVVNAETTEQEYVITKNLATVTNSLSVSKVLPNLESGTYIVKMTAVDNEGYVTSVITPEFNITDKKGFQDFVFGPVPFNPGETNGEFNYQLTQAAEIEIAIYSINGNEVFYRHYSHGDSVGGQVGFNRIEWDGRDKFGEDVANGPYVAYAMAKINGETIKKKVKIVVLK